VPSRWLSVAVLLWMMLLQLRWAMTLGLVGVTWDIA
jgi:hypothetical protein